MMLDNKSEQKCPVTATDYETGSQGSFLLCKKVPASGRCRSEYRLSETDEGPFFLCPNHQWMRKTSLTRTA